jgi:hypothetical protein
MGIEKVRIAICDTRGCGARDIHQKDKLSPGWEWWHVKWLLQHRIKVAESHAYDMYLFCPKCSNSTEAPDV